MFSTECIHIQMNWKRASFKLNISTSLFLCWSIKCLIFIQHVNAITCYDFVLIKTIDIIIYMQFEQIVNACQMLCSLYPRSTSNATSSKNNFLENIKKSVFNLVHCILIFKDLVHPEMRLILWDHLPTNVVHAQLFDLRKCR